MTIETTRAPEGAKKVTTEPSRGATAGGRTSAAGAPGSAEGGFAGLMSLLSASDAQGLPTEPSPTTVDDTRPSSESEGDDDKNLALALDDKGVFAINITSNTVPAVTPALIAGKGGADKLKTTDTGEALVASPAQPSDVSTLLNSRRASQAHGALQGQFDSRETRLQPANHQVQAAPEADRVATSLLGTDALAVSADRRENKSASGSLRTGLESAVGGAVADRLGISPTYEITAASAVVPDSQIAETVSYWATQGVQSAELTLDGLGNEPVEVRISVAGDQAQVDFRSNQPEVRQALEDASAQLRTMLSGEGLQLSGMSVGTSGRGNAQSDGHQPKPTPRQAAIRSLEPVRSAAVRPANLSVGRALDLYV